MEASGFPRGHPILKLKTPVEVEEEMNLLEFVLFWLNFALQIFSLEKNIDPAGSRLGVPVTLEHQRRPGAEVQPDLMHWEGRKALAMFNLYGDTRGKGLMGPSQQWLVAEGKVLQRQSSHLLRTGDERNRDRALIAGWR